MLVYRSVDIFVNYSPYSELNFRMEFLNLEHGTEMIRFALFLDLGIIGPVRPFLEGLNPHQDKEDTLDNTQVPGIS